MSQKGSTILSLKELGNIFASNLEDFSFPTGVPSLYNPLDYIMSLSGKRIRPLLLMGAYNLFKEDVAYSFEAGLCVEFFHNFSLLHDDIMDDADIRRGQPSVHVKYDTNSAILSGDVMLVYAYKLLEKYKASVFPLLQVFNKTCVEVCEGQRWDMDFECQSEVAIEDYLKMIEYKTSVLIAAALKMGAIIGEASIDDQNHLYEFGKNLGIAFQIQDDYLDTFGEKAKVGKRIGGDILQKKKTYLYLKSLLLLNQEQTDRLKYLFSVQDEVTEDSLIEEVKDLYNKAHVGIHSDELKLVYHQLALSHLKAISVSEDKKKTLYDITDYLLNRSK